MKCFNSHGFDGKNGNEKLGTEFDVVVGGVMTDGALVIIGGVIGVIEVKFGNGAATDAWETMMPC